MNQGKTKSGFDVKIACVSCKYKVVDANSRNQTGKHDSIRYCKLHEQKVSWSDVCDNYKMRADLAQL